MKTMLFIVLATTMLITSLNVRELTNRLLRVEAVVRQLQKDHQ